MKIDTAEIERQKAFNNAVGRLSKARGLLGVDKLSKPRLNPVVDRLSTHLNDVWQACRSGTSGLVEFAAALRDWEDESILALDEINKSVL